MVEVVRMGQSPKQLPLIGYEGAAQPVGQA
jgi:hypothetical protein